MTKDERSLLLYCEDCAVNKSGAMLPANLNDKDRKILKRWNTEGFVESDRITFNDMPGDRSLWCHLSDEAWSLAGDLRHARAVRCWEGKPWTTTAP